ncbi:TolC family protein [Paracrocinitomix mangrovi]|uniref:TolC family protein n=1 Tax=Paracrocinitomix mangrovi TaxID=2862509 RepID=UPI001C8E6A6D|nr:TolC family protein [Paracrocinitomix mangrovi]UKN00181.1 TolC family protein [Paracrocinitomix mangrovi]
MKKLIFLFLLFQLQAKAQDSITSMSFEQYIDHVIAHHPLAVRANNQTKLAAAYLMKAKGNFDPKLGGEAAQKYFNDSQYYSVIGAHLKVPTWYGISFQGGYDINEGYYLNPERTVPNEGLLYSGISLSLGRGLIIDQRRAELKKAQVYVQSNEQLQFKMLNDLIAEAAFAYWDWYKAYHKMLTYQNAVLNASERFEGVKQSAIAGDKPMIDTLESNLQLQNRIFNYLNAELDYLNAQSLLEIYMWQDGMIPMELDSTVVPPTIETTNFSAADPGLVLNLDTLIAVHPEILINQFKIDQKKIDVQLGKENLKPEVNFKYNFLSAPGGGNLNNFYSINNYNWGASLNIPIFLRKERGQLRQYKLELENLEAENAFKTEQISYKIDMTLNEWNISHQQIELWRKTTNDYNTLLQSEKTLFDIGESSLFMVNSREKMFISARLQLIDKMAQNKKAEIKAKNAIGILYNQY